MPIHRLGYKLLSIYPLTFACLSRPSGLLDECAVLQDGGWGPGEQPGGGVAIAGVPVPGPIGHRVVPTAARRVPAAASGYVQGRG